MSSGRALLFDQPANQISQHPWKSDVYLDPFDLERNPSVFQRAQRAMKSSFDIPLRSSHLLCERNGLPKEAEKHKSVYLYVDAPETTLGFYPAMGNPALRPRWASLGLHWDHFARRALFRPGPGISSQVKALWKRLFLSSDWVIGIHLRLGRGPVPEDKYFRDPGEALSKFWSCALQTAVKGAPQGRRVSFYLASDQLSAVVAGKKALSMNGQHRVGSAEMEVVRRPDGDFSAAALDLAMLEACNDLIGTRGSSYTFAAHSSRLISPLIVSDDRPVCERLRHSQAVVHPEHRVMPDHPWHLASFVSQAGACGAAAVASARAAAAEYRE